MNIRGGDCLFLEVLVVNFVLGRQGNGEEWQNFTGRIFTEIKLAILLGHRNRLLMFMTAVKTGGLITVHDEA